MAPGRSRAPEPEILIASIEKVERSYSVSAVRGEPRRVDDEAILDITGRIERIDPLRRKYLHERIDALDPAGHFETKSPHLAAIGLACFPWSFARTAAP